LPLLHSLVISATLAVPVSRGGLPEIRRPLAEGRCLGEPCHCNIGEASHLSAGANERWLDEQYTGAGLHIPITTYGDDELISRTIHRDGGWEVGLMAMLAHLSRSLRLIGRTMTFLDVGSNLGTMALVPLHHGHTCYLFEPCLNNADRICHTLWLNRAASGKAKLFKVAVGAAETPHDMYIPDVGTKGSFNSGLGRLTNQSSKAQRVRVVTLDSVANDVELPHNDLIVVKIDVEGFEHEVWRGGLELFERRNVGVVFIEVDWTRDREGALCDWMKEVVELRYEIRSIGCWWPNNTIHHCTSMMDSVDQGCSSINTASELVFFRPGFDVMLNAIPYVTQEKDVDICEWAFAEGMCREQRGCVWSENVCERLCVDVTCTTALKEAVCRERCDCAYDPHTEVCRALPIASSLDM